MRDWKRLAILMVMSVVLIVIMIVGIFEIYCVLTGSARPWTPAVEYPMANANISWTQTYYSGSWSDG